MNNFALSFKFIANFTILLIMNMMALKVWICGLLLFCFTLINLNAQNLISYELKRTYNLTQVQAIFDGLGIPPYLATLPVRFEVAVYKVTYQTVGVDSITPTIATGAFFVPINPGCKISLIDYNHGTLFGKSEAPSTLNGEECKIGVLMTTDGYGMVMPDYLGLGDSPGPHPYHHARSEATAVVDMIRACKQVADSIQLGLNGQLYITGYSQGGHVTMATTRMIESYFSNELNITASSPMSGAYDLSGVQAEIVVSENPYSSPEYLPYIVMSYRYAYNIYPNVSEVFRTPFDTTLPPLFDGNHGWWDIANATPNPPRQIMDSTVMEDYISDSVNNPLRIALRDNDVYDWVTAKPMKIVYCHGDNTVNPNNSIKAYNTFIRNGCGHLVSIVDMGGSSHYDCAIYALIIGKQFFDSLRMIDYVIHPIAGCHEGEADGQASIVMRSGAPPFSFLWENGDTTATSQRLHQGWNKVSISDAADCPVTDSVFIETSTFNISSIDKWKNITVYPNPVDDYLMIDVNPLKTSVISAEIISPQGKASPIPFFVNGTLVRVETSGLGAGIYFLKIRMSDQTTGFRQIVIAR